MRDVERFQQNFPVSVYSNGRIYAIGKFVRRHKATVAIAASGITAVLVALALTFLQYQRAERHLEESIERFDQVRELAKYQIFDLYDALKSVVGNTAIRAELAQKGQEYLSSLYQHSADSPQLQLETAQGFIRLARIYGVPAEPNLGDVTLARANLSKAEQLLSTMSNANPNWPGLKTTQVALMAAQAMILVHDNSDLLAALSLTDQADKLLLQVAEAQRDNYWYQTQRELRYAQFERADQAGQSQVIRDLANQSVAIIKNWPLAMQQSHIAEFDRAWYYYWMGLADYNDNLHEQAMENFEQGHTLLADLAERRGNDPMLLYIIAWNNYIAYGSAARLYQTERSMTFLDRATAASARLAELQEGDASIIRLGMQMREAKSQLLAELGRIDEAIEMQEALVIDQESNAKGKPEASQFETWAFSKIILAYMYRDANRREDACVELEQAEQLLKPFAEKGLLADYMMNAAQRLDSRIQQCRSGQPIASQNALFD
jgi:serine/threonine-protein kinase